MGELAMFRWWAFIWLFGAMLVATPALAEQRLRTIPPDRYTADQKKAAEEFLAARKVPVFGPFARTSHAAQRHHRAHRYVGHQCGTLRHGKGDPVRRDRDLGAGAGRPARVQVQRLVDVVDGAGGLQEASQRPGEAARGVDHPMVERVAE